MTSTPAFRTAHFCIHTCFSYKKNLYVSVNIKCVIFFEYRMYHSDDKLLDCHEDVNACFILYQNIFFSFLTLFGHIILTTRLCSSSLIIIAYINNKYQVRSDLGIKTLIFHTKCDHRNPTVVHIKKLFPHNFIFLIHVWQKGNVKSSDKW